MAHIQLLNKKSEEYTEKSLLDNCRRDPCAPEIGGGGYTMGAPVYETEEVEGPIQICTWP